MEELANLHPVAQVIAIIGFFTVIAISVYYFFKSLD